MLPNGPFRGRTIAVVNDLTTDEQLYLFNKTRQLKEAINTNGDLSPFKIDNKNVNIYLLFLEDSTRTKESFRSAANFHDVHLNVFDAKSSSFNKMESYADTMRMLSGYGGYPVFVIRSKHEGVCRWLEDAMNEFAERNGLPTPSFINAGDGKHEHPTQELLDEYSFYEQKDFKRDHIHIALIGDLYHGRTTHSKANGLKLFKEIEVDLIAPHELEMPTSYVDKMEQNGFKVRKFESIEEYISQKHRADIWYFTRLQLERMGEDVKDKANFLRNSVTFRQDFLDKVKDSTRFYHPLPRHREYPTVPLFLDKTPLNAWETQAINGYYTRIIEIGMLGGHIGHDYDGEFHKVTNIPDDFIEDVKPTNYQPKKDEPKEGIIPIVNGLVIDHIGSGDELETIWEHINKVRRVLKLDVISSHGVFKSKKKNEFKGVIAIPNASKMEESTIKKLGAIAPGCTLNYIENNKVLQKYKISMPPRIYNFSEIYCNNPDCITHPSHHEGATVRFRRASGKMFKCYYCDQKHMFKEIWDLKKS
jgi:aspartate carbamoyltransferase